MRLTSKLLLILTAGIILIWLLFRELIVQLLLAALLAFLLTPFADHVQRHRKCRRAPAAMLTMLLCLAGLAGLMWILLPVLSAQLSALGERIPAYQQQFAAFAGRVSRLLADFGVQLSEENGFDLSALFASAVQGIGDVARKITAFAAGLGFVLLVCYYLLAEPKERFSGILQLLPVENRPFAGQLCHKIARMLRSYFRSRVVMALFAGAFCGIGLWLIGVDNALLYAVLLFVLDFIPYFGPFVGGILPVAAAMLEGGLTEGLLTLLLLLAGQQLEESVIGPRLQADAVGIHPLIGILSLFACAKLFGAAGLFLAMPIAGSIRITVGQMKAFPEEADRITLSEVNDKRS